MEPAKIRMTAKTDAQRKADERARKRADGITEVRGIWALKPKE